MPPNLAPDNLKSYTPVNLGTDNNQSTTVASPLKKSEDKAEITDARSLASAVDNRVSDQTLGDSPVEQPKSGERLKPQMTNCPQE